MTLHTKLSQVLAVVRPREEEGDARMRCVDCVPEQRKESVHGCIHTWLERRKGKLFAGALME